MYAVIKNGGKQYKIEPGQIINLEKLSGQVGEKIEIKPLLMVGGDGTNHMIGRPFLEGYVVGIIQEQGLGKKLLIFKKNRRKGYRVKRGFRQAYTSVRVKSINLLS